MPIITLLNKITGLSNQASGHSASKIPDLLLSKFAFKISASSSLMTSIYSYIKDPGCSTASPKRSGIARAGILYHTTELQRFRCPIRSSRAAIAISAYSFSISDYYIRYLGNQAGAQTAKMKGHLYLMLMATNIVDSIGAKHIAVDGLVNVVERRVYIKGKACSTIISSHYQPSQTSNNHQDALHKRPHNRRPPGHPSRSPRSSNKLPNRRHHIPGVSPS